MKNCMTSLASAFTLCIRLPVCLLVKKPTESFCRAANTLFLILQTTPGTMYAVIRP